MGEAVPDRNKSGIEAVLLTAGASQGRGPIEMMFA
jgi:hypothetical protein